MTNTVDIALVILRPFPNLDADQRELIAHTDGSVLGSAGPGLARPYPGP